MLKFIRKFNKFINVLLDSISKRIGMNLRHLISFPLSKLYSNKVKDNLLVFGSGNGRSFSGNSKELFTYLSKNSKFHCIWITSSQEVLEDLKEQHYNVILDSNILQTIKTLKAAKFIFITHGFGDILMIDKSPDTKLIHLEHGIAFKKEGLDLKKLELNFFKRKIRKYLTDNIDYMVVTSDESKRLKESSFGIHPDKFLITGYPRTDIILNHPESMIDNIKKELDLDHPNEIILYAPTFRDYKGENPLDDEFFKRLDEFLIREKKVLIYKPHPFSGKIDLSNYMNIRSVNPNIDIMELLLISDVLVTDYSGVFFDFLLCMRPMIFYPYDLKEYIRKRDLYYDYESFVPGPIAKNNDHLIELISSVKQWEGNYHEKMMETRDLFNKHIDGDSTERIVRTLDVIKDVKIPAKPKITSLIRSKLNGVINYLLDFTSQKIRMNIRHLIAYPLSKLYSNKVIDNLLVFGSANGKSFSGNSRELFLYLNQNPNYNCVWFTSSNTVYKELKKQKYNVISNKKLLKTIKILKAAKYIFITHGFGDVLMVDLSPKTSLIHMEHGTKFKKEGYDVIERHYNILQRIMQKRIFEKLIQSIDYMIVSSEEAKRLKLSSYRLPPEKFLITGYPRNDILVNYTEKLEKNIVNELNIDDDCQILLYAPTYRDYAHEIPLTEKDFAQLDRILVSEKKILLYKPHPFSKKIDTTPYMNIKHIDPNIDIADLLIISDVLITDYSSVFFDYLLTMRPIIFYAYDLDKYIEKRDLYYEFSTFVPGPIVRTSEQLFDSIKNINRWDKEYEIRRKSIRDLFNKYTDGASKQRIIEQLNLI